MLLALITYTKTSVNQKDIEVYQGCILYTDVDLESVGEVCGKEKREVLKTYHVPLIFVGAPT